MFLAMNEWLALWRFSYHVVMSQQRDAYDFTYHALRVTLKRLGESGDEATCMQ